MLEELLKDPSKIGATMLLLSAVVGFFYELVVPGSRYRRDLDQLRKERDEFKAIAWQSLNITEQTQRIRGGGFLGSKDTPDAAR